MKAPIFLLLTLLSLFSSSSRAAERLSFKDLKEGYAKNGNALGQYLVEFKQLTFEHGMRLQWALELLSKIDQTLDKQDKDLADSLLSFQNTFQDVQSISHALESGGTLPDHIYSDFGEGIHRLSQQASELIPQLTASKSTLVKDYFDSKWLDLKNKDWTEEAAYYFKDEATAAHDFVQQDWNKRLTGFKDRKPLSIDETLAFIKSELSAVQEYTDFAVNFVDENSDWLVVDALGSVVAEMKTSLITANKLLANSTKTENLDKKSDEFKTRSEYKLDLQNTKEVDDLVSSLKEIASLESQTSKKSAAMIKTGAEKLRSIAMDRINKFQKAIDNNESLPLDVREAGKLNQAWRNSIQQMQQVSDAMITNPADKKIATASIKDAGKSLREIVDAWSSDFVSAEAPWRQKFEERLKAAQSSQAVAIAWQNAQSRFIEESYAWQTQVSEAVENYRYFEAVELIKAMQDQLNRLKAIPESQIREDTIKRQQELERALEFAVDRTGETDEIDLAQLVWLEIVDDVEAASRLPSACDIHAGIKLPDNPRQKTIQENQLPKVEALQKQLREELRAQVEQHLLYKGLEGAQSAN